MTKLRELHEKQGQSPWVDNLTRTTTRSGKLTEFVRDGIRGVTSNPTIFQKAIAGSSEYDEQFRALLREGRPVEDSYWELVITDIEEALEVLRPVYDTSEGRDGFVSLEVAPSLAYDTEATVAAARGFHDRIAEANLFVKIPATDEGIPAVERMISEGRNINITLIFSLQRYAEVIEAYLAGLETYTGDLSEVASVASFFVSRVDTEVDRRLDASGSDRAAALKGQAAVAQAKLAYRIFQQRFSGKRWEALEQRGARVQRPLWASTSTKNPEYPDLLYVDNLIGPNTINTMPDKTIAAFLDHGTVRRTVDEGVDEAERTLEEMAAVGVDVEDVSRTLEEEGAAAFSKSFDELIQALSDKSHELA